MADAWQRVGLIVNPVAGAGADASLGAARTVVERLGASHVVTGVGQVGAAALDGWPGSVTLAPADGSPGPGRTSALARWMASERLDGIVVVGGDGTLSDVALEVGDALPLVGIGTGSTNVGRLITCRAADVDALDPGALETGRVDALLASLNGEVVGMAFNDVVIGTTVVGTHDGQRCDLSAVERMRGQSRPAAPRHLDSPTASVARVAGGTVTIVAQGDAVGTVVAGFAEPGFFGKAIAGGICLASLTGMVAGCLVSDTPLSRIGITAGDLEASGPIVSHYVSLSTTAHVAIHGIGGDAVLCIDGNPVRHLRVSDHVVIAPRRGAAVGVRVRQGARSA